MDNYLKILEDFDTTPLSSDVERNLLIRAKQGDIFARNTLIQHNIRFGIYLLIKTSDKSYVSNDIEDLLQILTFSIIKTIQNFDLSRNTRFSTYLEDYVKLDRARYIIKNKSHRYSTFIEDRLKSAVKKSFRNYCKYGRHFNIEDVQELYKKEIKGDSKQIRNLFEGMYNNIHENTFKIDSTKLQTYNLENFSNVTSEIVDSDDLEKQRLNFEVLDQITILFENLLPIEIDVIKQRFGIDGEKKEFKEIGMKYSKTKQWAHFIYSRGMKKVKKTLMDLQFNKAV